MSSSTRSDGRLPIDAVLFDLDGTLVDSAPVIAEVLNGMRAERGWDRLPANRLRQWISLGAPELVARSLATPTAEVAPLVQEFRRRYLLLPTPDECLYPGARETVSALAAARVRLGVCSNKPARLCAKVLDDTGLASFFGAVVGGDSIAHPKPNREPLDHALGILGVPGERAILVGDSTVDEAAAKAAGLRFVFFTAGYDDGVDAEAAWARIDALPRLLAWAG